jgi:L,D-peptidoglycan transpeptidase YkuD (ErfK/YbiS/YcfS/YnhG family)
VNKLTILTSLLAINTQALTLPADTKQLILGLADEWQSNTLTLQRYERQTGGNWRAIGDKIPARGGRNGLAWGRGLHPHTTTKQEGDWKTPCGIFTIGGAYGYAATIQKQPGLPYRQTIPGDLWIEDTKSPHYNQLITLGRPAENKWEQQQQMRLGDPAHSLKLFIAHNAAPGTQPGLGSAIFFHPWRANGKKPTSGCTAMARGDLEKLIIWIDPAQQPLYILLPRPVYQKVRATWQLP